MLQQSLLADLVTDVPAAVRLQNLVKTLRQHFHCGAVVLLKRDSDALKPVAMHGLVDEALGRRFVIAQHPRLATLLSSRNPVLFEPSTSLPDPYDGLLAEQPGDALPVHDCMGISLYVEGQCWGVLTLDALQPGTFNDQSTVELQRFSLIVEAAIRVGSLEQQVRALRQNQPLSSPEASVSTRTDSEIIGNSPALQQILAELHAVAKADLPVLLLGETGVGKELFARELHRHSTRADKPMIYVNCAALPESLAESELFGHSKGAFSGASSERGGRFEAAHGGTLFLDEVGELPLSIQAKLLRVLQNGEVQRLGSDKPRQVDVRIVAATNRNLKQQVRDEQFRADLYHRLSVYPIPIPPLREREDDILLLAGHFLELNRSRLGLRALRLSSTAELALKQYRWPGNIRELEHVISRAAIKLLSVGVDHNSIATIDDDTLDLTMPSVAATQRRDLQDTVLAANEDISLRDAVEFTQKQMIRQALTLEDGNWSRAAKRLGVDSSNLHKLASRLGIK
ncbi:nitric oxide reductase transcriptional regulator NorR [Idiomarina sp. OT37-5b]|jgi:anaerobic nitric oxide reductase transcription regulator|uniref:Nitric oxide reductase transcriptional regulator NorR n=1 Tax=Idiomarina aquatica TaxID=1327752 RepID=A0AA94EGN0_9GAMM|nr:MULTISPECIES: nitric oxide reductase transcriptional regulator NorR [Idiomarina]AVJ54937.1 nitric oxide reductase transcriptional regulator NorR [Idiomarina sp. OT37-5b]RUO45531.1 nitric oxide reductase transcriptional regulator NorR [Idiomarina aquatica]